jgi:hypothetical protein
MIDQQVIVRAANMSDYPFIKSRWFHQLRLAASFHLPKDSKNVRLLPTTVKVINLEIDELLNKSYTLVAVDPADPTFIFGYTTFQLIKGVLIVHFAFTKKPFRAMGIQKKIVESIEDRDTSLPIVLTHENARTRHYSEKLPERYQLKPNLREIT